MALVLQRPLWCNAMVQKRNTNGQEIGPQAPQGRPLLGREAESAVSRSSERSVTDRDSLPECVGDATALTNSSTNSCERLQSTSETARSQSPSDDCIQSEHQDEMAETSESQSKRVAMSRVQMRPVDRWSTAASVSGEVGTSELHGMVEPGDDRFPPISRPEETSREAAADFHLSLGQTAESQEEDRETRLMSNNDTEIALPGRKGATGFRVNPVSRVDPGPDQQLSRPGSKHSGVVSQQPVVRRATSQTRQDLLTGDWTIFATCRDERPNDYASIEQIESSAQQGRDSKQQSDPSCPFCSGSENQTPQAVWSARIDQSDRRAENAGVSSVDTRLSRPVLNVFDGEQFGWDVRVVPNKFPAVSAMFEGSGAVADSNPLFPRKAVVGAHEVIIENACHSGSLLDVDASAVFATLVAYRQRISHWHGHPGIQYLSVFKNCGREAGASLRHNHSQLVATSFVPSRIAAQLAIAQRHHARTGCCLGCDLVRAELQEGDRIIDQTDSLLAFCPYASKHAGMIRITSRKHQPHFESFDDSELDHLGSFLQRVLHWVEAAFPGKGYNYLLNTCPAASTQPEAFHWSLDVFPRLTKVAGFEWASDCMINSLLPEVAAAQYRHLAKQEDPRSF